jgi:Tol biopolymer transport system component
MQNSQCSATWSPDGRRFVVNSARRGDKVVLVRRPASGSGAEEVPNDGVAEARPAA